MKRVISAALCLMLALSLAACGSTNEAPATTAAPAAPAAEAPAAPAADAKLTGTVSTDGSTSMEKVIGALGEAFTEANGNVNFTYNPTGSGSGIQAVQEGRCDIGLSSRALKDEEKASGLTETILAYDGIAVIVNPENPVEDLTLEDIAKIYTGEITNWSEVGGNDAEIVLIGREAGSGIKAVQEGRCDIGLSSRALTEAEMEQGLTGTVLAYDGIAVIVNPANTVEDLTVDQIAAIYRGEITNWSEVGGMDAEIVLVGREAGSGTRSGFEEIVGVEDLCQYRQELTSTGDVITAVSQNPGAIGYASLASVKDTVKAIKVGGVAPSDETVKDETYAIQRPFVLVTKEGTALTETAQAFFDFITSEDAREVITAAGVVPAN